PFDGTPKGWVVSGLCVSGYAGVSVWPLPLPFPLRRVRPDARWLGGTRPMAAYNADSSPKLSSATIAAMTRLLSLRVLASLVVTASRWPFTWDFSEPCVLRPSVEPLVAARNCFNVM